jgi:putative SOS response-associated peptidase YedK
MRCSNAVKPYVNVDEDCRARPAYTMVMVDSCEQMAQVHDRMPVILRPEQWAQWADGSPAQAAELFQT